MFWCSRLLAVSLFAAIMAIRGVCSQNVETSTNSVNPGTDAEQASKKLNTSTNEPGKGDDLKAKPHLNGFFFQEPLFPGLTGFPALLKFFAHEKCKNNFLLSNNGNTGEESQMVIMLADPKENGKKRYLLTTPEKFREKWSKSQSEMIGILKEPLVSTTPNEKLSENHYKHRPLFVSAKPFRLWPQNRITKNNLQNWNSIDDINEPQGASSEIDSVKVRPNFDLNSESSVDKKWLARLKSNPIPFMWFRSDPKTADTSIENLLQEFENAVIAELKQLRQIEMGAKQMRDSSAALDNKADVVPSKLRYPLNSTPLYKITWQDIEAALNDEYMKKALQKATKLHWADKEKRDEIIGKYLAFHSPSQSDVDDTMTTATVKRQAVQGGQLTRDHIVNMLLLAHVIADEEMSKSGEKSALERDASKMCRNLNNTRKIVFPLMTSDDVPKPMIDQRQSQNNANSFNPTSMVQKTSFDAQDINQMKNINQNIPQRQMQTTMANQQHQFKLDQQRQRNYYQQNVNHEFPHRYDDSTYLHKYASPEFQYRLLIHPEMDERLHQQQFLPTILDHQRRIAIAQQEQRNYQDILSQREQLQRQQQEILQQVMRDQMLHMMEKQEQRPFILNSQISRTDPRQQELDFPTQKEPNTHQRQLADTIDRERQKEILTQREASYRIQQQRQLALTQQEQQQRDALQQQQQQLKQQTNMKNSENSQPLIESENCEEGNNNVGPGDLERGCKSANQSTSTQSDIINYKIEEIPTIAKQNELNKNVDYGFNNGGNYGFLRRGPGSNSNNIHNKVLNTNPEPSYTYSNYGGYPYYPMYYYRKGVPEVNKNWNENIQFPHLSVKDERPREDTTEDSIAVAGNQHQYHHNTNSTYKAGKEEVNMSPRLDTKFKGRLKFKSVHRNKRRKRQISLSPNGILHPLSEDSLKALQNEYQTGLKVINLNPNEDFSEALSRYSADTMRQTFSPSDQESLLINNGLISSNRNSLGAFNVVENSDLYPMLSYPDSHQKPLSTVSQNVNFNQLTQPNYEQYGNEFDFSKLLLPQNPNLLVKPYTLNNNHNLESPTAPVLPRINNYFTQPPILEKSAIFPFPQQHPSSSSWLNSINNSSLALLNTNKIPQIALSPFINNNLNILEDKITRMLGNIQQNRSAPVSFDGRIFNELLDVIKNRLASCCQLCKQHIFGNVEKTVKGYDSNAVIQYETQQKGLEVSFRKENGSKFNEAEHGTKGIEGLDKEKVGAKSSSSEKDLDINTKTKSAHLNQKSREDSSPWRSSQPNYYDYDRHRKVSKTLFVHDDLNWSIGSSSLEKFIEIDNISQESNLSFEDDSQKLSRELFTDEAYKDEIVEDISKETEEEEIFLKNRRINRTRNYNLKKGNLSKAVQHFKKPQKSKNVSQNNIERNTRESVELPGKTMKTPFSKIRNDTSKMRSPDLSKNRESEINSKSRQQDSEEIEETKTNVPVPDRTENTIVTTEVASSDSDNIDGKSRQELIELLYYVYRNSVENTTESATESVSPTTSNSFINTNETET